MTESDSPSSQFAAAHAGAFARALPDRAGLPSREYQHGRSVRGVWT